MNTNHEGTEKWKPVYREALPVLLDRLRLELDLRAAEIPQGSSTARSLLKNPSPLAEFLGVHTLDLERAWVVTCAELLGLDYVDFGLDRRDAESAHGPFAYLRVMADVLESLQETLGVEPTEAARRAGLSLEAWKAHLGGDVEPEQSLPRVARGLGMDVGELERRIVARCLREVGLSSSIRLLTPGPSVVLGGVLLPDGRLLTLDVFRKELWLYEVSGEGRKVEVVHEAMHGATRVQRAPGGALWIFGDDKFLEVTSEFESRRSYGVWGRRDDAGRLLENVLQWSFLDDDHVAAVSFAKDSVWVVRLPLTSGGAGRFEVLESLGSLEPMEKRFFVDASPKLAVADGEVYLLRVRRQQTEVHAVGGGGAVASYAGGTETMEQTARMVGDPLAGLTALGLVSLGDEILVWRRQGHRYWLEDLAGRRWSRARKSQAAKWVPVVGERDLGLLEMAGEGLPGSQPSGLLWLDPEPERPADASDFGRGGAELPRDFEDFPTTLPVPPPPNNGDGGTGGA